MSKTIDINWSKLTEEHKEILLSLGFKPSKRSRKASPKKYTNLKDKGVSIQIQRNIFCYCCGSTTVEFITSYVPKELVPKNPEAITDSVRTCKKCVDILLHKPKGELASMILHAYRTYTY